MNERIFSRRYSRFMSRHLAESHGVSPCQGKMQAIVITSATRSAHPKHGSYLRTRSYWIPGSYTYCISGIIYCL